MTLETRCLDSGFRCNSKLTHGSDFIQFIKKFEESYKKHYATCNWQCLKKYITYSIGVLDYSLGCRYSERVEELISGNPDVLSIIRQIKVDNRFYNAHFEANKDSFEYNGLLYTFIFASNPKFYDKIDLGILELDSILYKCAAYTNLYTSLADVYVRLNEFNIAFNKIIELSVVLYLIRCEVEGIIRTLDEKEIVVDLSAVCNILNENGIYTDESYDPKDPKIIVISAINHWAREIQFEVWSVLIKIWLQTPCMYSILRKIESLDFSLKIALLLNFDIFLSKRKSSLNLEISRSNKCDFVDLNISLDSRLTFENLKINLPPDFVISYLFTLPFNYQCFVIEGLFFISHMCKDFSYAIFCYIYSLLYDILGTYISTLVNILNIRNEIKNTTTSINLENPLKTNYKSFSIPRAILIAHNQHIFSANLFCIPSYYNHLCLHTNSGEPKSSTLLYGFYRFGSFLKVDLESQILFTCTRVCPDIHFSETITVVCKHTGVASRQNFMGREFKNYVCSGNDCKISDTKIFADISNGSKIADITKSISLCYAIGVFKSSWSSKKGRKLKLQDTKYVVPKHLKTLIRYYKHDLSHSLIEGIPDSITFSIISLLFLFDGIYSYLHYNQSVEFLQYKDLLRKKQRAFVRYFFPCVPTRSTKETKEMTLFQKYIRNEFKENLLFSHDSISKVSARTSIALLEDNVIPSAKRPYFRLHSNRVEGTKAEIAFIAERRIRKIFDIFKVHKVKIYLKSVLKLSRKPDILTYKFRHLPIIKRVIFPKFFRTPKNLGLNTLETESYKINSLLSKSDCAHISMAQDYGHCRFCHRLSRFKHMEHSLCILDLLVHYLFTWNTGKKWYSTSYLRRPLGSDLSGYFGEISHNFDKNTNIAEINKEIRSVLTKTKNSLNKFPRLQEDTITIVDELIENTMLLSLSTFFSEKYYNKLVSRLSLVQLLQGRSNLFLSLMKQSSRPNNNYKTNLSEGDECNSYTSNLDQGLKIALIWKVLMEVFDKPLIFGELCAIIGDFGLCSYTCAAKHFKTNKYIDNIDKVSYSPSKLLLMEGAAHLKLSHASSTLCPIPITDIENDMIHVMSGPIKYFLMKSDTLANETLYPKCNIYAKDRDGISLLISSTRLICEAIFLDPLDYKAWLYLSHCGLFSHDYYLAYKCSKRSIECFDSCVASWLMLIISTSSRVKTCAPFRIGRNRREEVTLHSAYLFSNALIKPIPSPFNPILYSDNDNGVMPSSVGGDIDKCLNIISSITHFNSIYVNCALLQLLSRTSEFYNPLFPWESYFSVTLMEFNNSLPAELDNAPSNIQESFTDEGYHNDIKRLVKNMIDGKLLLCSAVFMGPIASAFLKHKFDFKCTYHENTTCFTKGKSMELNFLEEEIYGWITCIEVLAQTGRHKTSQLLIPLIKMYIDAYTTAKRNKDHRSVKFSIGKTESFDKRKIVERSFGHESNIGVDLTLEFKFLELYVCCFGTGGSRYDLTRLLMSVREEGLRQRCRKLSLLENRILVALGLYHESILLSNKLHRVNFKGSQEIDFELECISLKAYAYALAKTRQHFKSSIVNMFADQCSLTTPVVKLDLCLNVPL